MERSYRDSDKTTIGVRKNASSLLRTSPPPGSTRPHSHELAAEDIHPIEAGFPCYSKTPAANMPSPLPRRTCRALSSLASPAVAAFPLFQRGRRSHYPLGLACRRRSPPRNEACSVFTPITAYSLADPLAGPFTWQYLNGFRYLHHPCHCYRVERQFPGGFYLTLPLKSCGFPRHTETLGLIP